MDRKTKYQWISPIAVLVSIQVIRDLTEKYGDRASVDIAIIGIIVMAGLLLFFTIFGKKSERKQVSMLIPFFGNGINGIYNVFE